MSDTQDVIDAAVAFAMLKQKIESLEEARDNLNSRLRGLEKEKDNAMRWGLYTLGSAVLGLVLYLTTLFGERIFHP
jgi:hypothetical protein